jgi:hypothetical protein
MAPRRLQDLNLKRCRRRRRTHRQSTVLGTKDTRSSERCEGQPQQPRRRYRSTRCRGELLLRCELKVFKPDRRCRGEANFEMDSRVPLFFRNPNVHRSPDCHHMINHITTHFFPPPRYLLPLARPLSSQQPVEELHHYSSLGH